MRWQELLGEESITNAQRVALCHLAKLRWPEKTEAEFGYWLVCHGYYRIHEHRMIGSTERIPGSDYRHLERELHL